MEYARKGINYCKRTGQPKFIASCFLGGTLPKIFLYFSNFFVMEFIYILDWNDI